MDTSENTVWHIITFLNEYYDNKCEKSIKIKGCKASLHEISD
jgi:hypothetical protein